MRMDYKVEKIKRKGLEGGEDGREDGGGDKKGGKWVINDEDEVDIVICTVPILQVEALADKEIWQAVLDQLGNVQYDGCLTGVFTYSANDEQVVERCKSKYGFIGSGTDDDLVWTGCENYKTGRIPDDRLVFVAHTSAAFSKKHMEEDPKQWTGIVRKMVEEKWNLPADLNISSFGKRWRYARVSPNDKRRIRENNGGVVELAPGFFLCGDGVIGRSIVEDSFLSGIDTAEKVLSQLKSAKL